MSQEIVRFEPNDGTSYIVIFHRLSEAEKIAIGGFDILTPGVLFGFSPRSGPWNAYVFNSDPNYHIEFGYYASKMDKESNSSLWTLVAGVKVFSHLTGRELFGIPEDIRLALEAEWGDDWKSQLAPLR